MLGYLLVVVLIMLFFNKVSVFKVRIGYFLYILNGCSYFWFNVVSVMKMYYVIGVVIINSLKFK